MTVEHRLDSAVDAKTSGGTYIEAHTLIENLITLCDTDQETTPLVSTLFAKCEKGICGHIIFIRVFV